MIGGKLLFFFCKGNFFCKYLHYFMALNIFFIRD